MKRRLIVPLPGGAAPAARSGSARTTIAGATIPGGDSVDCQQPYPRT